MNLEVGAVKLVHTILSCACLAAVAMSVFAQEVPRERQSSRELNAALVRMVADGERARGEARPDKLAQSGPCQRLGGKPEAPMCGGTCPSGQMCDVNFPKTGLPNCLCQ